MSAPLDSTIAALREALGDDRVRVGDAIGERSMTDWTGHAPARPAALVLPRSTEEVSRALAICNEARQSVVPQGGMTGLAGGAIARPADIAISLDRLAGIEEIDKAAATMTVLAGTTLQAAQEAATAAGSISARAARARSAAISRPTRAAIA
jgi:FAD/FMN-containing dehydrogenase